MNDELTALCDKCKEPIDFDALVEEWDEGYHLCHDCIDNEIDELATKRHDYAETTPISVTRLHLPLEGCDDDDDAEYEDDTPYL